MASKGIIWIRNEKNMGTIDVTNEDLVVFEGQGIDKYVDNEFGEILKDNIESNFLYSIVDIYKG